MSAVVAIARASARGSRAHIVRATGGRRAAALLIAAVLVVVAGVGVLIHAFLAVNLPNLFVDSAHGGEIEPRIAAARESLVQSQLVTGAVLVLALLAFTSAESGLSVAARVAGARPAAIVLGEFLPTAVGIAALVCATQAGPIVFEAQSQPTPVLTGAGLAAAALTVGFGGFAIAQLGILLARLLRLPASVTRMIGATLGLAAAAVALAQLLASAVAGRASPLGVVTRAAWAGHPLPTTVGAVAITAAAMVIVVGLTALLMGAAPPLAQLGAGPRILRAHRFRRPDALAAFVVREIVLLLRHPVSQLGLLLAVLLCALLATGVRLAGLPLDIAVLGQTLVLAGTAETAAGRSRGWQWILDLAGYPTGRRVIAQYLGAMVPAAVLQAAGVAAMVDDPPTFLRVVAPALLSLLTLGAVAALAGTVVPYSASAPLGMVLTSTVALGGEIGASWVTSSLLPAGSWGSIAAELGILAAALGAAALVARRRSPATT
ncbi:hypothetical protein [Galbitalea soli]|uniref:ABC-2 type transport system permease protein n=1 Tax=Galbitalea soli TaxID=1268042 RepID=A0A7C9TRA1_9MICO|nr:hypothetical protein [Galbitalea soli]NEM92036.1 hypothetical protein [Galbitalea soli]NYJ32012.1 hypothetical protein [Galbitalea soli]